ncbi:MAG: hypothetical protein ACAI35_21880 [Candidatus Methylacidiphilales bacterium]|nr:hypothetical protein [Candidatus Methylacidiphilales bacterium]
MHATDAHRIPLERNRINWAKALQLAASEESDVINAGVSHYSSDCKDIVLEIFNGAAWLDLFQLPKGYPLQHLPA